MNPDVTISRGFNAGKDGQSKIPQFFAWGSDTVKQKPANVAATPSMEA